MKVLNNALSFPYLSAQREFIHNFFYLLQVFMRSLRSVPPNATLRQAQGKT